MFSFFKKRETFVVSAPIKGKLIKLEDVNDEVFSQKMMGDGFAVMPENDETVVAPISGTVEMIPDTKHAVGIKNDNGVEVLVHIGLDTVDLQGQGFTAFVKKGQKIKRGDKLIKFDAKFMEEKKIEMPVMTIFTSGYDKEVKTLKEYGSTVTPNDILLN